MRSDGDLTALESDISLASAAISHEGVDPLEAAADQLLAGDEVNVDSDAVHQAQLKSLSELRWRRKVLRLAITKQRDVVDTEVARVSREVCEDLEPEYLDIVDELATMLLKVADASEREQEFRDRLITGGIQFATHLRPMPFRGNIKEIKSTNGMLCAWFKDGIDHGVIDMKHVPQPWRDRWFKDHPSMRS